MRQVLCAAVVLGLAGAVGAEEFTVRVVNLKKDSVVFVAWDVNFKELPKRELSLAKGVKVVESSSRKPIEGGLDVAKRVWLWRIVISEARVTEIQLALSPPKTVKIDIPKN